MPIPSSDLTAVLIKQNQESLLIISAYVEYNQNSAQCKRILEQSLQHVRTTLQKACQDNPSTRLVLAGDFNRHDSLWGGQGASWRRQGEGEPILQFMAEHQLWSALPQGTTTYSNDSTSKESTIDLMLVPSLFRPMIISCQTYGINHGSDHRAISLKLNGYSQLWKIPLQRRSYNMAVWEDIRQTARARLGRPPTITTTNDLDKAAHQLETQIQSILQEKIPPPKAFPYAKRWWSRELTNLRKEYNYRRNQWTAAKRRGDCNPAFQRAAIQANRVYLA